MCAFLIRYPLRGRSKCNMQEHRDLFKVPVIPRRVPRLGDRSRFQFSTRSGSRLLAAVYNPRKMVVKLDLSDREQKLGSLSNHVNVIFCY